MGRSLPGSDARRFLVTRGLPIGLVLILVLSGNATAQAASPPTTGAPGITPLPGPELRPVTPAGTPPINTTLTVNRSSVNLSSLFWGATVNNEVRMFRGEPEAVNATPARVLVWPGAMAGEDYNPLTNIHYDTYSGTPKTALTSEAQFVQMCEAIHCTAVVQVPAEIDSPQFAESIVNYTEVNLSFHPAYWMIGNEPELWSHWKVPWKDWPTTSTAGPDPTQFGHEVVAYVNAIRAVDNTTPILGLPASGCTCGSWTFEQWIAGVLNVTGPKIQAVAYHEYPAGWLGTGDGSLEDFYATIQGLASIPVRTAGARAAVQSSCPGCNVSVWISELGSALSWSAYGQYAAGFSGGLSLASQITQGMDDNVSNIDLFATELATLNSWFSTTGHARPDYSTYTEMFGHLGTQAFAVNVTGLSRTIYGIDTIAPRDQGRRDLMVVNDNITHAISFSPRFAEFSGSTPVEAWSWNGSIHNTQANGTTWVEPFTANAVPQGFPNGLPANYTLPPQSMVIFEAYPSGGTYVQVLQNGVPSPTAWYANVGSHLYETTASNLSLLLPTGAFPVAAVTIPLPIGGRELNPIERLTPFVASPLQVNGAYTNTTINFVTQWRTNITTSPIGGGTVTPQVDWWNASEPLNLTVVAPAPGYAFVGWSGWGPGSYNGSGRSITVVPAGRITERARFVVGDQVNLLAQGLPTGTPWSVTIRGFTTTANTSVLTLYEPYGTYGYSIHPVPGYRILPRNGGFTVDNPWIVVDVRFIPITPPQPAFPVTFQVSGLPASTSVLVTVRGASQDSGVSTPLFQLLNGTYAYHVGYVAGYHLAVPEKLFAVRGGSLTVDLTFVPTMYRATWAAVGVRSGMNWSVELNGTPIGATSAWVSTSLPNGTYSYSVNLPSNFSASPRTGVVTIAGTGTSLSLIFNLVEFPTLFKATGLGASTLWSIRFGNETRQTSANGSSFLAANGSYTFNVDPPSGYYAVPSHGNLTVAGASPPTMIRFYLSSERPSAALVAALSSGALWVSVWIGVAGFAGFAAFRGLRRRGGGNR